MLSRCIFSCYWVVWQDHCHFLAMQTITYPKYTSLSNESWEPNGRELFGKQFEQRLKQRVETAKQFPLLALSKEENRFFQEALLNKDLESRGEGEKQQHPPRPSQPLQAREESSGWYRYVPRTFFNAHSFKTTNRGQNISFLSELAEHYKQPLGSGYFSGIQDRVFGISSPVLGYIPKMSVSL